METHKIELQKKMVTLCDPLVTFITGLPESAVSQQAMMKLQEMAWWLEKAIKEEIPSGDAKAHS